MTLEYHKHKKGRVLQRGSSPRDLQNRHNVMSDNSGFYNELLQQINDLKIELNNVKQEKVVASPAFSGYTEEEFNEALEKALLKETEAIERAYKLKLEAQKVELLSLQGKVQAQEDLINTLQETITNLSKIKIATVIDEAPQEELTSERPQIQEEIIDPSEDPELESHITIESVTEEAGMSDKLSKLKNILG